MKTKMKGIISLAIAATMSFSYSAQVYAGSIKNGKNFTKVAVKESNVQTVKYDFKDNTPKMKYLGEKWSNSDALVWNTNSTESQSLAYIENEVYGDFEAETKVTLRGNGNAGLEFRINNVVGAVNQYQGYMAGIGAYRDGKTEIFLLKHDFKNTKAIKQLFNVPIVRNKEYKLKVVAKGANIKMYLDDKLWIDENDSSFSDGYIGYSLWNNNVKFDDLIISKEKENEFLKIANLRGLGKSTCINALTPEYGAFTGWDNVKDKKLSANTYSKLKNEISKIGIPGNVVDFVLENVAGVEGDNVGEAIADLLPGSIIYGNKLAGVINNIVNNEDFEDVNLYREEIKPQDNLKGFSAVYEILVAGKRNIQGDLSLSITGIKYGKRDNFTVEVSTISKDGKETKMPVVRKQINEREANFEAQINGVNSNTDKIRIYYNNKFNKPKDPSRYVADLIRDGVNKAAKEVIKNDTVTKVTDKIFGISKFEEQLGTDLESISIEIIREVDAKHIAKALKDVGFDEIAGNGDVGKFVADTVIANVPLVGKVVKAVGGTDWIAKQVRKIVGQAEIMSYAKLSGAQISIKNNVSGRALTNLALECGKNSRIETVKYDFKDNNPKIKYLGEKWSNPDALVWNTNAKEIQSLAVIDENDYSDFEAETKVTLLGDGNAGLEFRINNVVGAVNQYQGYMAGIGAYRDGKTEIFLLKHDFKNTRVIKQLFNVPIVRNKEYKLKVVAKGANIKMYVDGKLYIDENDSSFSDGYIGYALWNSNVKFDDLTISERTADNKAEYNFSSNKPHIELYGNGWFDSESISSSNLMCASPNTQALGVINGNEYSDFIAETNVTLMGQGGNAGIEFRINDVKGINNQFRGYLAAMDINNNGEARVFLGKHDFDWKGIKVVKANINKSRTQNLRVMAIGSNIKVFLNDKLMIDVNDSSFVDGYIGYSLFNSTAIFDNFEIISLEDLDFDNISR
jgi:hypothetical protein